MEAVVIGYVVKEISKDHPRGRTISRVYHVKAAAAEFAKLMQGRPDAPEGASYHVTDKLGAG